jgi:two-component system sensor histidine kinase HydH
MERDGRSFRQHILVVDDDPAIRDLLSLALEEEGYHPILCAHPMDAMRVSDQEPFDLAFVDIVLPEMNGLELASELKANHPQREVVFITGSDSYENAVQAIKIGAYDFLRKPFGIHEFRLCLRRFQEKEAFKKKIELAERRYFQLVQNIPLLIFVLQKTFQLEFVNEACREMLGYSPEEALNLPDWFRERIHPDDRDKAKKLFESAFIRGLPVSMECRFVHRDGHSIFVILKSIPSHDHAPNAEPERLEGFMVDITDRIFLERALVQREKLKTLGAISAEVAHEIRNPLASIGGFARRLKQKIPDLRECDIILSESERLEKILSRIRNYLKPVEIYPRACSVNAIIRHCLELLSPEIERKRISCLLELEAGMAAVSADPEVLSQVFINLIRNATEAVRNGEKLIVKTYQRDQSVYIQFKNRDTGKQIENHETMFTPFAEGGQSIGLPLCFRLVRDMGGMLSFRQEAGYMIFAVALPKAGPKDG